MDKNQEILSRTRVWARPSEDEAHAEQLAQSDPALAKLHRQQKEFNARVHDELAAIPVPTGLRDQILARKKIVRVSHWSRPLLAMAAAFIFLAAGLFYWRQPHEDMSIAGFRSRMVGFAVREYRMDWFTNNLVELRRSLAAKGDPTQFALPPELAKLPLKGGASLTWQEKPVSMICFDWKGRDTLYMFVLDEPLVHGDGSSAAPQLAPVKGLSTVTWSVDGKTFLLSGRLPERRLAELVKS